MRAARVSDSDLVSDGIPPPNQTTPGGAADATARSQTSPLLQRLDLLARIQVLDDVPVAAIGAALLPGG